VKLKFFGNLQFRVALILLLVSVAPLGIVSVFSVRTAEQAIQSIATNQLENLAEEKKELLGRWIAERKADLEVVAGSAAVQGMDPAQIRPYITLVQSQYGVYRRFIIVDRSGRTVDDNAGAEDTHPNAVWYREALKGQRYFSEVGLGPDGQESVFRLAAPIRGPDGTAQGAVCATVSTQAILERVLSVSLGDTGECYLVDKTGTFLAHNEPGRILKDNIAKSESFLNIFGEGGPRPIYRDYRGIPVLGASRAVEVTKGTEWYVVVEQDRDEAFASSDQLVRNIYIVIALTVAGAVGLSWLLALYVSSPIRTLSEAAHALSRGDFENALAGARTRRSDEIGALHVAFQHMAGQLWDRHASLEKRMGLTEEELRKSDTRLKNTLEAAARSENLAALGRLAAGVAHEIRTPLTSLKLFFQSVRDDIAVSPEHSEDLRIALQQVRRIENTINHFLDFARPQEPLLSSLDFARLLDDALVVVQPRANQQEVEVLKSIAPELPQVDGDMRQLGESLVNLLANALEAMPDGGRLEIAVAPETTAAGGQHRQWVRIDVSDTGSGIREEDLERLFEPFFTTKASGSGLGLTIVQGTLQRHGGTVKVRTQPGEGTTFSIYLPVAAA
jgi:signal transduction histidine kinase